MTGKVSVKGNILLLQKLDSFWNQVQGSREDPEFPFVKEIMLKDVSLNKFNVLYWTDSIRVTPKAFL